MFAAGAGHLDAATLLIEAGADVNTKVKASPAFIEQIAKSVEEGLEQTDPHKDDVTALMVAAQGGHLDTVQLLVGKGADVRAVDEDGVSALINAVKGNYGDVASFLVESGANPDDVFVDDK
ncbi:unnamed protein product, partial [Discosporangium mesarthrocarpum]